MNLTCLIQAQFYFEEDKFDNKLLFISKNKLRNYYKETNQKILIKLGYKYLLRVISFEGKRTVLVSLKDMKNVLLGSLRFGKMY